MGLFKRTDKVRLIQPVIEGEVVERVIIDDVDNYRVQWTDESGLLQERLFSENQLKLADQV